VSRAPWLSWSLERRVMTAIEEVRPAIQADGGDVSLVAIEGSTVRVRLEGACVGCPMARSTLSDFVAERVQLFAPEIEQIVAD